MILPFIITELSDPNDRAMMSRIYEEYFRCMFTTAYHILRNGNDVADGLHDCWLSWCKPHDLQRIRDLYKKPGCDLRLYIASCLRNRCFTRFRDKKKRMEPFCEDENKLIDSESSKLASSVEDVVALRIEISEVVKGIKALPPYQRQLMIMRYLDGQMTKKIEKKTGIAANTIRAVLSKAKRRLKLDIESEEESHGEAV